MNLQSIKTEEEYEAILEWVDRQFDLNIAPDTTAGHELQMALILIKKYEDLNYNIIR